MSVLNHLLFFHLLLGASALSAQDYGPGTLTQPGHRGGQDFLSEIRSDSVEPGELLAKAARFTRYFQKDSARLVLEQYEQRLGQYSPDPYRNADYYDVLLDFAITFNAFEKADQIVRQYRPEPSGTLERRLRQYPMHRELIPSMYNRTTGFYAYLAFLNTIQHPSRLKAYKQSGLFDEEEYDYESWYQNIDHAYLNGKWNQRVYQALRAAPSVAAIEKTIAYDHLLLFNNGLVYDDEEYPLSMAQIQHKLDSTEKLIAAHYDEWSSAMSEAYRNRITYYYQADPGRAYDYFVKLARNQLVHYQQEFAGLDEAGQQLLVESDSLFFHAFSHFALTLAKEDDGVINNLVLLATLRKNPALISEYGVSAPPEFQLMDGEAILDVIRYRHSGKAKYAMVIITSKIAQAITVDGQQVEALMNDQDRRNSSVALKRIFPEEVFNLLASEKTTQLFYCPDGAYDRIDKERLALELQKGESERMEIQIINNPYDTH